MNFKKNLIFLSALALCGSAAFSGFGNGFFNISSSVSVSADENDTFDCTIYKDVVNEYIEKYGKPELITDGDSKYMKGIYAQLIDFNNDGIEELFLSYLYNPSDEFSEYIKFEVYGIIDGAVKQVLEPIKTVYGQNVDEFAGVYKKADGTYAIHFGQWSSDQYDCDCMGWFRDFWTFNGQIFENEKCHSLSDNNGNQCENAEKDGYSYIGSKTFEELGYYGVDAPCGWINPMFNLSEEVENSYNTAKETVSKIIPETPPETTEPETPTETAAWKDAYKEILKSYDADNAAYGLYDLDNDGIPELFVSSGFSHAADVLVYTYDSDNVIKLDDYVYGSWGAVDILKDSGELVSSHSGQGISICSLYKKTGDKMEQVISYWDNAGAVEDGAEYKINEQNVSKEEYFDSYDSHFKGKEVLTIGNDNPSVSDLSFIDNYAKEDLNDEPKEPEKTQKSWQKAYADFISGKDGKFSLVYIDNDDIPELIYATSDGGSGISIYKYSDGEVISVDNCGFADNSMNKSVAYLEKQNLICVTDARTNGKYYYLYTIENDELKENGNISFGYLNKDFSIDGNPATEDECNAKADEYKIPDMTAIDRDAMYDINEENVIKYLSVENDTQETEKPQNNNTNNNNNNDNNNNNNNTKNNTANNGGKSATADKTGVSPDTGDKGTGIALCVAASAVMAAWITRKKD